MKNKPTIKELLSENRPLVMGILNVTPDSFADGGKYNVAGSAIAHAQEMIAEGADIIDIGAESSRPGSDPVSEEEEFARLLPVLECLGDARVPISVDTMKPTVAQKCLAEGADMINDIAGLTNPDMTAVVAEAQCSVVIMHMQGEPKTMQKAPHYDDVIADIKNFFQKQITSAKEAGITEIILDPGIGFGKTLEHNLAIINNLAEFSDLGYPVLLGASRKSFIEKITGEPVEKRLSATIAVNTIGFLQGAKIFRVHDVAEHVSALALAQNINHKNNG